MKREKKRKQEEEGEKKVTADCEGGGDEGSQRRKRQGWMNGWMKGEVQEQDGARTRREDVEITARKKRGRMEGREADWTEKKKREQNAWEI